MCEFCSKFDFATATTSVEGEYAHIYLALCNTSFPKEQQFNFCPVCGKDLRETTKPKADCSKCVTDCRAKHWFEHEMWVKDHGCKQFKSRDKQK